jgi:hypothetical protein
MSPSRRMMLRGIAAASAFPFLKLRHAAADDVEPQFLSSDLLKEIKYVNSTMGPTRLTASPQHGRFVAYMKSELESALIPSGGTVFEDTFANYPRWTARAWRLHGGDQPIPLSSYYPYCTGGFTGTREPLVPAMAIAAPGTGGGYPVADGSSAKIIPPVSTATGTVVNLGTFTGVGSINWAPAAGQIAYIDYSVVAAAALAAPSLYTVNETYDRAQVNTEGYYDPANPTLSILLPVDLYNAVQAGVLGVILGWTGISDGNAQGQYNPFTVPFSSYPPSSQAGSDSNTTLGGIPSVWVNPTWGDYIKNQVAGSGISATITLEADIEQVTTSTVWGILPGASYGTADDEFLICNTHSDGPNIFEENGGIAVFNAARYFAQLPSAQRPKSMVFMASTGHFGHGLLGSGRDWIAQHPQIVQQTVGVVTIEHLGCLEWEDLTADNGLVYSSTGKLQQSQLYVTAPSFQTVAPGPADQALLNITSAIFPGTDDRGAILSGGIFFGEGGPFHALGIPTIGYIPVPQYLCAMYANGGIDKMDIGHFQSQLSSLVQSLLAMQSLNKSDLAT